MRLIDRDDFNALAPSGLALEVTMNVDGTQDPGPYLFCVNDTGAWVSRLVTDRARDYSVIHTAPIDTATVKRDRRWTQAVHLWLQGESIDPITLVRRYKAIARRLEQTGSGVWSSWDEVCYWPETSDLLWDGLAIHSTIERREHEGQRQVRHK